MHIAPLITKVIPVNKKDIMYEPDISYMLPANGGPSAVENPSNIINIPKAFVIFSIPTRSTNNKVEIEIIPPF